MTEDEILAALDFHPEDEAPAEWERVAALAGAMLFTAIWWLGVWKLVELVWGR